MPEQPTKGTEEGLARILSSLEDSYGLILRRGTILSPSKRRQMVVSEEELRTDKIFKRIHHLHYQDSEQLARILREFDRKAYPRTPHGAMERAALQEGLLACLSNQASGNKRESPEAPVKGPKKSKRSIATSSRASVVDAIPVRSESGSRRADVKSFNSSLAPTIVDSARTSFTSFSSSNATYDGIETAQTSFCLTEPDATPTKRFSQRLQEAYTTGKPASRRDMESTVDQDRRQESDSDWEMVSSNPPSRSPMYIDLTSDIPSNEPPTPIDPGLRRAERATSTLLEDRLSSVWPRDPAPGLNEAPLAVLWEVARIASECKTDFRHSGLKYEANDLWHNQLLMRARLGRSSNLSGQSLPAASGDHAWETAISNGVAGNKMPIYSINMDFNEDSSAPLFNMRLQPIKLDLGHRFARRFGSDRWLEVNLPQPSKSKNLPKAIAADKKAVEKIVAWLTRQEHCFLGRIWASVYVRDSKKTERTPKTDPESSGKKVTYLNQVYLFAIDGHDFRCSSIPGSLPPPEDAHTLTQRIKVSRGDLLTWAINLPENLSQHPHKLFSRLALSLSRTHPTVVLQKHQIIHESNIGTHKVMNDGAGRMSFSLARKVAAKLGIPPADCPCAYQGRIGSAKGMWIIEFRDNQPDDDWIEIYPSQEKWVCDFDDVHHRTFEVKDWPRGVKSASLNQQFIPVLETGSADHQHMRQVVANHVERYLHDELNSDLSAMDDIGEFRLWLQQHRSSSDDHLSYIPFQGGLPRRDEDALAFLADSGFEPKKLRFMQEIILKLKLQRGQNLRERLNITIPCSAYLLMIPDFWGILDEGEVHVSFSSQFQVEGFSDTLLEGMDVIVARAPAHFPSDMQRVKVVSREGLRGLKDVIIFSTKGASSLADKLSGGDYDGDRAWVCWDRQIVDNFNGVPVPKKPDLLDEGFLRKSNLSFDALLARTQDSESLCSEFMFEAFSFNMQQSQLGICTKDKEIYCFFKNTISDPAAIAMSTLLSALVDQSKQGIIFSNTDKDRFYRKYLGDDYHSIFRIALPSAEGTRRNPKNGNVHILEYLQFDVVNVIVDAALERFNKYMKRPQADSLQDAQQFDGDLTKPWKDFDQKVDKDTGPETHVLKELRWQLKEDIERLRRDWLDDSGVYSSKISKFYQQWLAINPPENLLTNPFVKSLMDSWCPNGQYNEWALLKASATFNQLYRGNPDMAWRLAGRQLAHIKACMTAFSADTAGVHMIASMWAAMRPDKKLIQRRTARRKSKLETDAEAALDEVMEFDDHGSVLDDT